ncbi:MAG: hypothetical protein SFU87_20885, partial [Chitinophagaceae bacterium]|nr:hypothetical protein [Chitinophagaceae bacterium]
MKSLKLVPVLIIALFFLSNSKKQNEKKIKESADNWNGTVTWTKTSASKGKREWEEHGKKNVSRWDKSFEFKITVNFINGKGNVVRLDKTINWGKDSLIFVHPEDKYMITETTTVIDCSGQDISELSVEFSEDKKHYWISFFTPTCPERITHEVRNNIHGNTSDQSVGDHQGIQITLP